MQARPHFAQFQRELGSTAALMLEIRENRAPSETLTYSWNLTSSEKTGNVNHVFLPLIGENETRAIYWHLWSIQQRTDLGPWVKKNTWKGSHPSKVVPWQKEALAQSSSLVQEVKTQKEVGMVTQLHKSQENLVQLKLWNSLDKRTTGTIWYIVFSTGSVSRSSKGHSAGSNSWQPRIL